MKKGKKNADATWLFACRSGDIDDFGDFFFHVKVACVFSFPFNLPHYKSRKKPPLIRGSGSSWGSSWRCWCWTQAGPSSGIRGRTASVAVLWGRGRHPTSLCQWQSPVRAWQRPTQQRGHCGPTGELVAQRQEHRVNCNKMQTKPSLLTYLTGASHTVTPSCTLLSCWIRSFQEGLKSPDSSHCDTAALQRALTC